MKRREFLTQTAGLVGAAFPFISLSNTRPCSPPTLQAAGGTVVTSSCAEAPVGMPTWLADKPLNLWFEIPNTSLSSCPPSQGPQFGHPGSKIGAWCGATVRRKDSVYLIAAAGGHGDYGGNEVNALVLNSNAPRWVELRASSSLSDMIDSSAVYRDLRRAAQHTYSYTQFINQDDRLVIAPSFGMGVSTLPDATTDWQAMYPAHRMMCSFGAQDWSSPHVGNDWDVAEIGASGSVPKRGFYSTAPESMPVGGIAEATFSDFTTGDVYKTVNGNLWKWSRATDSWTIVSKSWGDGTYAAACLDPVRRNGEAFNRFLFISTQAYPGRLGVYRSDNGAQLPLEVESASLPWSTLTSDENKGEKYPGIVFDESNDRFIVFINGRNSNFAMYEVKYVGPNEYRIIEMPVAPASGSTVPDFGGRLKAGHSARNGIHNAVQYVPELKGIVVADQYADNVHFMRVG